VYQGRYKTKLRNQIEKLLKKAETRTVSNTRLKLRAKRHLLKESERILKIVFLDLTILKREQCMIYQQLQWNEVLDCPYLSHERNERNVAPADKGQGCKTTKCRPALGFESGGLSHPSIVSLHMYSINVNITKGKRPRIERK
jgi:hypothetical protein